MTAISQRLAISPDNRSGSPSVDPMPHLEYRSSRPIRTLYSMMNVRWYTILGTRCFLIQKFSGMAVAGNYVSRYLGTRDAT